MDSVEFREHFSERNISVVAHVCFYEISTISYNNSVINKRAFILSAFTTERKVNIFYFGFFVFVCLIFVLKYGLMLPTLN